ncbi:hypothetical protein FFZ79_06270, partial [Campylobacter coli]|nr:hypothetical protein [Campylobacter coli]
FYFKQKFSTLESFFYIGGIVFDALNYKKFCKDYKNNFFLKYRNEGGGSYFYNLYRSKNEIL